jgi:OTU domain-containing protein 6
MTQARKQAATATNYSQADPQDEAKLIQEARDEQRDINRICDELSLTVHEARTSHHNLQALIESNRLTLTVIVSIQRLLINWHIYLYFPLHMRTMQ